MSIKAHIVLLVIFTIMGFVGGLNVRKPAKIVEKQVMVWEYVPVTKIPVNFKKTHHQDVIKLAAAIPASTLGR